MSPTHLVSAHHAPRASEPIPPGDLSDSQLADAVATVVANPRERPADSFILHAPLELIARVGLLSTVAPAGRSAALERMVEVGAAFQTWAAADEPPAGVREINSLQDAMSRLQGALRGGDLDDADRAASWLAAHLDAEGLRAALADPVVPLLSAAGHGSIFLYHLPRVVPRSAPMARMLRSLARELARNPGWDLSWFRGIAPNGAASAAAAETLAERLRQPRSPGRLDTNFIYPTMSLTESSGLAEEVLHDLVPALSLTDARRVLLRTAAMSMLQDDPAQGAYGWSHCLTMPQATLGVATACETPADAVAVAATYVLGFRSTIGRVRLDPAWEPARPQPHDAAGLLDLGTEHAVSTGWHAAPEERPAIWSLLATAASAHHDAHLVKHTLACIDAAGADAPAERLYLAAAAHLAAWWATVDGG